MLPTMSEFKGSNGHIAFDGQTVKITRKGLGGFVSGNRGEKTIPLASVTGVEFKAGGLTVGYLQVSQSGHSPKTGRNKTETLLQDENTVTFYSKQNDAARAVADEINAALLAKHSGASTQAAPDVADQIRKLSELRDQGILSEDEFTAKKAELLERL